ncbi:hypothetical protein BDV12DRAFT_203034 [Aspergillus spectabilis]
MTTPEEPVIPPPPGRDSNFEDPEDVLHTVNFVTQVVSIIVVTLCVILRIVIKMRMRKVLELEDYLTIIGWVTFIGFCASMLVLNKYGGGYHAWDVPASHFIPFQKASYAVTLLYVPMVYIIKLALLSIMLRLFAPDPKKVQIIHASIIILTLYYIPAVFIKIFFCKPISAYWYGVENGGSCMDQRKVIIADSAISIASDFWILILPVPMLWSLKMSLTKKMRVVGILGAGGLATGFSIWRLYMMVVEGQTADTTWFWIHAVLTANAEAGMGLICACLPALSAFFVTVKTKSRSGTGSYPRTHELSSWNKLSSAKMSGNHSANFPPSQTDQSCLISTVEGPEAREGSLSTLQDGSTDVNGRGVIRKDVLVEQSYEYVK